MLQMLTALPNPLSIDVEIARSRYLLQTKPTKSKVI